LFHRNVSFVYRVINTVEADIVVVLDNERLFSHLTELKSELPSKTTLTRLQKNGGVVPPNANRALEEQSQRFRRYFYGHPGEPNLAPKERKIDLRHVSLFTTTTESAPMSALPLGGGLALQKDRLMAVNVDNVRLNSIIAVTAAESSADVGAAPALGFLHVKSVDRQDRSLMCLAPLSGPIPGHGRWLVGSVDWFEQL